MIKCKREQEKVREKREKREREIGSEKHKRKVLKKHK